MANIRYDGRVAIVTGAGGGLGRAHALLLASRGAKVVVNDLGGALDGKGGDDSAANKVVQEIKAAGGEAVPNYNGVDTMDGGQKIVQTALDTWGRVDIVVANAGILRDVSFPKLEEAQWDAVLAVHLKGTLSVAKAAWPHMREAGYGRLVFTTSASGLYGNFGQSNYGAAKLGIVGLMNTLAQEGAKYNIKVNSLAPVARSRMTENLMPPPLLEKLTPEAVSPVVGYLCSEQCQETGRIYSAGGGYFARVAIVEGPGVALAGDALSPDQVAESWDSINKLDGARPLSGAQEHTMNAFSKLGS